MMCPDAGLLAFERFELAAEILQDERSAHVPPFLVDVLIRHQLILPIGVLLDQHRVAFSYAGEVLRVTATAVFTLASLVEAGCNFFAQRPERIVQASDSGYVSRRLHFDRWQR